MMNLNIQFLYVIELCQDDIVVHFSSNQIHVQRVLSCLQRFCEFIVAINSSKCVLRSNCIKLIDYDIISDGFNFDIDVLSCLAFVHIPTIVI